MALAGLPARPSRLCARSATAERRRPPVASTCPPSPARHRQCELRSPRSVPLSQGRPYNRVFPGDKGELSRARLDIALVSRPQTLVSRPLWACVPGSRGLRPRAARRRGSGPRWLPPERDPRRRWRGRLVRAFQGAPRTTTVPSGAHGGASFAFLADHPIRGRSWGVEKRARTWPAYPRSSRWSCR